MKYSTLPLRLTVATLAALALLASCKSEIKVPKDPPEARKDYAHTDLNTAVILTPLANDYDADDAVLTVTAIGAAAHGTAVLNGNQTVTYTPNIGYLGGDEFTVTVRDAHNNEVTESAYVTVGDSVRFIYISNFADYFTRQLYLSDSAHPGVPIPVSGRLATTEGPVVPGMGIPNASWGFEPTADGQGLVFVADDSSVSSLFNLFYADMDTLGSPIRLTSFVSGQAPSLIISAKVSPDKLYVYYMSNEFNPDVFEIVRVEIANPANKVRMNPALTSVVISSETQYESIPRFDLSPDGTKLIYVKFDPDLISTTNAARELYVMDTAVPGVAVKLSGTPTAGTGGVAESTITGLGFKFVPGTDLLAYPSAENGLATTDIYLVDYVAQTAPVKLSGTSVSSGITSFKLTPDGTRLVYQGSEVLSNVIDIYLVDLATPGVSTRLSAPRTDDSAVQTYMISTDNSYVIYVSDESTEGINEVYFVDFANPTVRVKLNHALRAAATPNVAEQALTWTQVSAGMPRSIMYATNAEIVDGKINQIIHLVDVDNPTTNVEVGSPIAPQFVYMWNADGETFNGFDDPNRRQVISAFEMKISDPAHRIKLTPEQFPGASVEVNLNHPFLP